MTRPRSAFHVLWLVLGCAVIFAGHGVGQSRRPFDGPAPKDFYELRYIGCKLTDDKYSHSHEGIFVFIWKGEKATQILAYASPDRKVITPFPSFSIHDKSGWKGRGEWCGTGAQWVDIQPGQVLSFTEGMMWIEREMPGYPSLKEADRARFNIASWDGGISTEDFPLPLFPAKEKK